MAAHSEPEAQPVLENAVLAVQASPVRCQLEAGSGAVCTGDEPHDPVPLDCGSTVTPAEWPPAEQPETFVAVQVGAPALPQALVHWLSEYTVMTGGLHPPLGVPHAFRITGDAPAKILGLTVPGRLLGLYDLVGMPAPERRLPGKDGR